jgi:hypothetical protein
MIELTQAHEGEFGSCWQTAVACILEVPAEALPDQHLIEMTATLRKRAQDKGEHPPEYYAGHFSYMNALNAYLAKHHDLAYLQEYVWHFSTLRFAEPGFHFAIGPTSRNSFFHCVVARHGEQVWDPNPSRAGLTRSESFGWLARLPPADIDAHWLHRNEDSKERDRQRWANRAKESPSICSLCCCPECFVNGDYR